MKHSIHGIAAAAATALLLTQSTSHAELKLPRPSPNATVKQTIGLTDVTVTYSRPGVKGRKIWGELVPFGESWRTGANEATAVTFSEDVKIGGKPLLAGSYALLTIPTQDTWTVVFNKKRELSDSSKTFSPGQDTIRVVVKPQRADHVEWLEFSFENLKTNSGDLVLRWEKLKTMVSIETDDLEQTVANVHAEIAAAKPDDWQVLFRSADFFNNNNLETDLAAQWAEKSVAIKPGYLNLALLARIRAKQGKTQEAIAQAEKAIKVGKEGEDKFDTRPTERLVAEWMAKK